MGYIATTLQVRGVVASMRFYCEVLGCSEWFRWEQHGQLVTGGVQRGEGHVILDSAGDMCPEQLARRGIGVGLYLQLDDAEDIEALWASVQGKAPVLTPIGDRPWGDRTFTVADPDGFHVTVSRTIRQA